MTTTFTRDSARAKKDQPSRGTRQFGYLVGIGVGLAMLYVANRLFEWGWFGWLTEEFEKVLPIVNVSIWAGIIANALYLVYDSEWFKLLTQIPQLVIAGLVGFRMLDVFPFDFSSYKFAWDTVARWTIILPLVGIGIALIVVTIRFFWVMGSRVRPAG